MTAQPDTPVQPAAKGGTASPALGVGVDVVAISAFAEQLRQPGTRFARSFTAGERRAARAAGGSPHSAQSPQPGGFGEAQCLAARWAAKEAVIKAWSSSRFGQRELIDPAHVDLREIEVRSDAWGRPAIRLHGAVARAMAGYQVLVSLSHDPAADTAIAFVVLQNADVLQNAQAHDV